MTDAINEINRERRRAAGGYDRGERVLLLLLLVFVLGALLVFGFSASAPRPDAEEMERRVEVLEQQAERAVRRIDALEARATTVTMIGARLYLAPDNRDAVVVREIIEEVGR